MSKLLAIATAFLALVAGSAHAALLWLPNATDVTGGAQYTIKQVWEFSDGNNVILQVEVNESVPNQGCTSGRPNTFFVYSNPVSSWQQEFSSKLMAAQVTHSPIKAVINTGTTNWCLGYGLNLWGLEVIVP